jgi:O-antigen/teichoic acid export membrane protein
MLRALTVVGSARVVAMVCQALSLLLVARQLPPVGFGQFAAVFGALQALSLIADAGATYAVGRHHTSPQVVRDILQVGRLLAWGTLAVSVPALGLVAYLTSSSIILACAPLCLWVPFERQAEVHSAYLMSGSDTTFVSWVFILRRLPVLLAVLLLGSPVLAFGLSTLAATAVSAVLLDRRTERSAPAGATASPPRDVLRGLRPYWFTIVGQGLRRLDVAVLTLAAGPAVSGIFAPASRLVAPLLLVPGTYSQMLLARMSASQRPLRLREALMTGTLSTGAFLVLAATAEYWIPLLLGPAYVPSIGPVQIIVSGLAFATVASLVASSLQATDRPQYAAVGAWTGTVTTLVLVLVLGRLHGAAGAAWATVLGYVVQLGVLTALAQAPRSGPAKVRCR